MYQVKCPESEQEWQKYYAFRWQMLREPLKLPRGSERDEYDEYAYHRMIFDQRGEPVAVGRLYQVENEEGQIRFIAVKPEQRSRGVGTALISALEDVARDLRIKRIVLNARLDSIEFFERNGYHRVGDGPTHFGKIKHQQMQKNLNPLGVGRNAELSQMLNAMWQENIPICEAMHLSVRDYDGKQLITQAGLSPNLTSIGGMFAGTLYSQAMLTGWSLLHLMLKERHIKANISSVQGEIRHLAPATGDTCAKASMQQVAGRVWPLLRGKKVMLTLPVKVFVADVLVAEYLGKYMLEPSTQEQKQTELALAL